MKNIGEVDIQNKTVLLRVDFNVTIEHGRVTEDFRMRATLPTIEYLLENGAKRIVVMSHLGRPPARQVSQPARRAERGGQGAGVAGGKGENNSHYSLAPVSEHLSQLLGKDVEFIEDWIGEGVRKKIDESRVQIIFLENLRFYKEEETNDEKFAKKIASLGDFFVQDAFGVCHREHASIVGVPELLPSYAGLRVEKEVSVLSSVLDNPKRPLAALIGGAKISTKIKVIEKFLEIADNVCLGGALANTALKAGGIAVGRSFVEDEITKEIEHINFTDTSLHLPIDVKVAKNKESADGIETKGVGNVLDDEIILDIGKDTQTLFSNIIHKSKTIVWNGPMGYIENEAFQEGTQHIAREIAKATSHAFTVVGGGDTYLTLEKLDIMDKVSFVSSGGGAMLDFLAKGTLPGLEVL